MAWGPLRFGAPFAFAASIPAGYYAYGPYAPAFTIAALIVSLVGAEVTSPRGAAATPHDDARSFRWLPILYIPLQLCVVVWALAEARRTNAAGFAVLATAVGITTGVFGVLAAHELVHGRSKFGQYLAAALLSAMAYRHFRIAHVFGHHRWAATERDPSTARLGEGFYHFAVRTIGGQWLDAWRVEQRRVVRCRLPLWRHRLVADAAVMCLLACAIILFTGARGIAFFLAQSAVAILTLELFNYIAHYGLLRRIGARGREPFGEAHSWNSSNVLANALIFNMGRHSHHHARPLAPYQTLQPRCAAPELPLGYAGSILLALVPPLWRRVMDPAVQRLHTRSSNTPA